MPITEFEDLEMSLEEENSFVPVTRYTDEEDLRRRQRRHEIIFDLQHDDDFKSVMEYYRERFKSNKGPTTASASWESTDNSSRFLGDVEIRGNKVIFIYYETDDDNVQ